MKLVVVESNFQVLLVPNYRDLRHFKPDSMLSTSTGKIRKRVFSIDISRVHCVILCSLIYAKFPNSDCQRFCQPSKSRQSESFVNLDVFCDVAKNLQALREVFLQRLNSGRHVAT